MLFAVLFISSFAWAQTNPAISRDFDREMADYGAGSIDTTLLPTSLSQIPLWMNSKFNERQDTLYVLGISDPGLIDTVARKQAVLRALALGALANGTECDHFSDFYLLSKESQGLRDKTPNASSELLRERSRTRLSWRIKAIDIYDDKMWVNITTSKF